MLCTFHRHITIATDRVAAKRLATDEQRAPVGVHATTGSGVVQQTVRRGGSSNSRVFVVVDGVQDVARLTPNTAVFTPTTIIKEIASNTVFNFLNFNFNLKTLNILSRPTFMIKGLV